VKIRREERKEERKDKAQDAVQNVQTDDEEEEEEEEKKKDGNKGEVQVILQEIQTNEEKELLGPEPELEQPKARDGYRFVQRTLLSHLGIGARPSQSANDE
jgi:hypothetical protein